MNWADLTQRAAITIDRRLKNEQAIDRADRLLAPEDQNRGKRQEMTGRRYLGDYNSCIC